MERATLRDVMKNRIPEELVSSPLFLLKRLGMKAKEQHVDAYADAGVHPYHYAILATLAEGERETQGAIADALDYDRGQLVGILDELEERGLVERRRDPKDRRRHTVTLTDAGKQRLVELREIVKRIEDEFLAALDTESREALQRLLLRVAIHHDSRFAQPTDAVAAVG